MTVAIGIKMILMGDELEIRGGVCGELSRGVDGWWEDA